MGTNELQIGDWVSIEGHEEPAYILDVDGDKAWLKGKHKYYPFILCDKIHPIPLTKEILKANGFVEEKGSVCSIYTLIIEKVMIVSVWQTTIDAWNIYMIDGRMSEPIHYVHELQQALRLCRLYYLAASFKVE